MRLRNNIFLLLMLAAMFWSCGSETEQNSGTYNSLSVAEAEKMRHQDDVILLDVRTDEEFNRGHIPDARQINYRNDDFKEKVSQLDKNKTYIVYCHSGPRSSKAARIMNEQGFEEVYNLSGGISQWKSENLPIEE